MCYSYRACWIMRNSTVRTDDNPLSLGFRTLIYLPTLGALAAILACVKSVVLILPALVLLLLRFLEAITEQRLHND